MYLKKLNELRAKNYDHNFSMEAYGELLDNVESCNDVEFISAVAELVFKAVAEIKEAQAQHTTSATSGAVACPSEH